MLSIASHFAFSFYTLTPSISVNYHKNLMRQVLLWFPFYSLENRVLGKLSNLRRVIQQLVNGRANM